MITRENLITQIDVLTKIIETIDDIRESSKTKPGVHLSFNTYSLKLTRDALNDVLSSNIIDELNREYVFGCVKITFILNNEGYINMYFSTVGKEFADFMDNNFGSDTSNMLEAFYNEHIASYSPMLSTNEILEHNHCNFNGYLVEKLVNILYVFDNHADLLTKIFNEFVNITPLQCELHIKTIKY